MNSRLVVGFCVDKEEDAKLLDFLNSKKNKSEFIRSVLYDKLNSDVTEKINIDYNNSTNKILLDVLSQITMLTNRLLGLEFISIPQQSPLINTKDTDDFHNNQQKNTTSLNNPLTITDESENIYSDINSNNNDDDNGVFGAAISSLNGL